MTRITHHNYRRTAHSRFFVTYYAGHIITIAYFNTYEEAATFGRWLRGNGATAVNVLGL